MWTSFLIHTSLQLYEEGKLYEPLTLNKRTYFLLLLLLLLSLILPFTTCYCPPWSASSRVSRSRFTTSFYGILVINRLIKTKEFNRKLHGRPP